MPNMILVTAGILILLGLYFFIPTLFNVPFNDQAPRFLSNQGNYTFGVINDFNVNRTPNSERTTVVWVSVKMVCETLLDCDGQINATVTNSTGGNPRTISIAGLDGANIGAVGAELSTQQTATFFVPPNATYKIINQTNAGTVTYDIVNSAELTL